MITIPVVDDEKEERTCLLAFFQKMAQKLKEEMHLSAYQKNYKAISFYQREDFVIQSESIDNDTNEKELLMSWKK